MDFAQEYPLQPPETPAPCASFTSWLENTRAAAFPISQDASNTKTSSDANIVSLCDAHCHLDLMLNGMEVARDAERIGLTLLNMGIAPDEFTATRTRYRRYSRVLSGIGAHPWFIDEVHLQQQLRCFDDHLDETHIVGEIGLDFSPAHAATADAQLFTLRHILDACAQRHGLLLSIHAVRSAQQVLDELEQSGAASGNLCVFHWFSGSSNDLQRAIRIGALFSINPHMLQTKRGREYVRVIPTNRMLFETDAPARSGEECTAREIADSLRATASEVRIIKGGSVEPTDSKG